MKKLLILNGPNINMTGARQRDVYGTRSYSELVQQIKNWCKKLNIKPTIKQSNHEGDLIELIQNSEKKRYDAIIINPGAYSHYSIAILDALLCVSIPKIEVHMSNVLDREDFRKKLITSQSCDDMIYGKGFESYMLAIDKISKMI